MDTSQSFPYRKVCIGVEQALEELEEEGLIILGPIGEGFGQLPQKDTMREVSDRIMEVLSDPIYRDSLAEFVAELQAKAKE